MSALADALLEAHVQHELERVRTAVRTPALEAQVAACFQWLAAMKLDDVANRGEIAGIIERYVIDLRVSGGVAELSGEMARVVLGSRAAADTRLDQILPSAWFDEFVDKLLALKGLQRELLRLITTSASFNAIRAGLAARGALALLLGQLPTHGVVSALAARACAKLLTGFEQRLSDALTLRFERLRGPAQDEDDRLELSDSERLRGLLDEVWSPVSSMLLSDAFALVGEQDIEDFVVLIYEFWLHYRKTEFFHRISLELVDHFFAKYGQQSLAALLDDMGVTPSMVSSELSTVLGPIVAHAAESGFLERQLREHLRAFYDSDAARALLEG